MAFIKCFMFNPSDLIMYGTVENKPTTHTQKKEDKCRALCYTI